MSATLTENVTDYASANADLNVDCESVFIIPLTIDGFLPKYGIGRRVQSLQPHISQHLPPRNNTEATLLSMWLNTHQAMFISTGVAAHCVNRICQLLDSDSGLGRIIDWTRLAVDCRHASAVYTSLPHLTREHYEAYLRPSMMAVHPGFSGVSNRESITMEQTLHKLTDAHTQLATRNRTLAEAVLPYISQIQEADRTWWKFHGKAMGKYVYDPTSLARMDFKHQKEHGSNDRNFTDYRNRVLRQDNTIADYDVYFAVTRTDNLTINDYILSLERCLKSSASYIEHDGVLAQYRERGTHALHEVLMREKINYEMNNSLDQVPN